MWRIKRGESSWDGWDMMSGGNGYSKSDLAAASKWFFGWIPDDAIVLMQPEGATEECPTCLARVDGLVLKPFDDVNVPPSKDNLMAVHIPILASSSKRCYSYWLSYRGTGNDLAAAGGLSIHVSWFKLGGIFGASYDSLNYDAFGDTSTTADSFVVPGTCYVVAPSPLMMDIDIAVSESIQPIVCVDDVNEGQSVTISVSFLDLDDPPETATAAATERLLGCSESGSESGDLELDVSEAKTHLLHYEGTGFGGSIDASFCVSSNTPLEVTAYFYDRYVRRP